VYGTGSVGDRSGIPGLSSRYCGSVVNLLACQARVLEVASRADKGATQGAPEADVEQESGKEKSPGSTPSVASVAVLSSSRALSGTGEGRNQGRRRRDKEDDGDDGAGSCLCLLAGCGGSPLSICSLLGLALFTTTSPLRGETEKDSVLTQGRSDARAAETSGRTGGSKGAAGAGRGAERKGPFNDMPGSACMQREGPGISRASALERPSLTSAAARAALQDWPWRAFLPLLPPPLWSCCCLPWNSTLRWLPPQRSHTCLRPWMHGPSVAQEPVEEL